MKRTIAITLTVAMIGGLMFMGFAGTAAAQVNNEPVDDGINIETGDVTQTQFGQNFNAQTAIAEADGGASASVGQGQTVTQSNTGFQQANTGVSINFGDEPVNNQA